MRKHWLTTLFGILAAIGGALTTTQAARTNLTVRDVAAVIQTLGIAGIGLAAADNNKLGNSSQEK